MLVTLKPITGATVLDHQASLILPSKFGNVTEGHLNVNTLIEEYNKTVGDLLQMREDGALLMLFFHF